MNSKFDAMLIGMESLMKEIKGEIYNFDHQGKKNAAKKARKALSELKKLCFNCRKEILCTLKAMPVQKRK